MSDSAPIPAVLYWMDGKVTPASETFIPAHSPTVMYGEGCFETLYVRPDGEVEDLQEHLRRLQAGIQWLGLAAPDHITPSETLRILEDLKAGFGIYSDVSGFRLRIQVGGRRPSAHPSETPEPGLALFSLARLSDAARGENLPAVRLASVPTRVIPEASRPNWVKHTGRAHYNRAEREARNTGADEPLMLTVDGFVSETSRANVFWIEEEQSGPMGSVNHPVTGAPDPIHPVAGAKYPAAGAPDPIHPAAGAKYPAAGATSSLRILTPSTDCDLLPGIMRKNVIQAIQQNSPVRVEQGRFTTERLLKARSVFLTNSIRQIQPVASLDGHSFDTKHEMIASIRRWLAG